jgi:hypothetical protein
MERQSQDSKGPTVVKTKTSIPRHVTARWSGANSDNRSSRSRTNTTAEPKSQTHCHQTLHPSISSSQNLPQALVRVVSSKIRSKSKIQDPSQQLPLPARALEPNSTWRQTTGSTKTRSPTFRDGHVFSLLGKAARRSLWGSRKSSDCTEEVLHANGARELLVVILFGGLGRG